MPQLLDRRLTALDVLKEARSLLARPKGWIKGAFNGYVPGRGYNCYCAVGAINQAAWRDYSDNPAGAAAEAKAALAEAMPFGRYPGQTPIEVIFEYNDDPRTRKKDILAAFDKAIETLEKA